MAKPKTIYQLKVTLKEIKPPIWRRLQVPADIKLDKLHMVLQDAVGWTNSHLHQFVVGEERLGTTDVADFDDPPKDEKRFELQQIADEKLRLIYEYDFGDGWDHEILVEKILPADAKARYPICLAGKRACPPEDCGGPWGYEEFLEALANPSHERHDELTEWIGRPFDPENFDVDDTNVILRASRSRRQYEWVRA